MRVLLALAFLIASAPCREASAFGSAGAIADAIRDSVAACHPNTATERYEVVPLHSLQNLTLELGDRVVELAPPHQRCGVGRCTYHLRVERGSRVVRLPIGVEVERWVHALGLTRDVPRGGAIGPDDVEATWFDVTYTRADPVIDGAVLAGVVARTRLRRGVMLSAELLVPRPVVAAGSAVKLRVSRPGFQILAEGVAREDGALGDRIRVKNLSTGRIVRAVVVEPGLVEI